MVCPRTLSSCVHPKKHLVPTGEVDNVAALGQGACNILGSFYPSQLDHATACSLGGF